MTSDEQNTEKWKQKYYDQLDQLESGEKDWKALETTLKRAIGRISLAAEGQNTRLDRHLGELRSHLKNTIDRTRLESIIDDISRILSQLGESPTEPDRASVSVLEQLVSALVLHDDFDKPHKKLLKQLNQSTDTKYDALFKESLELLKTVIARTPSSLSSDTSADGATARNTKSGFLNRLFNTHQKNTTNDAGSSASSFTTALAALLSSIPWPDSLSGDAKSIILSINKCTDEMSLDVSLQQLEGILKQWPADITNRDNASNNNPDKDNPNTDNSDKNYSDKILSRQSATHTTDGSPLESSKACLIELLNTLDNPQSPNGKLTAFKLNIHDTHKKHELDKIINQLPQLLVETLSDINDPEEKNPEISEAGTARIKPVISTALHPSIQELLIRLLEQLIVPQDLLTDVEKMKLRLGEQTEPTNWKSLLKDVAALINSIRSKMQQEKHEFENFLQQVTDRLKTMDNFFQLETTSLQQAETDGNHFDTEIHTNVNEIRQNVNDATELSSLKQNVSSKLDTVLSHIKHYRETENQRVQKSQNRASDMHSRIQTLEQETQSLKKEVIEKNRQAMVDALTAIPNRLAYEKKIEEEISRWKRFNNPLSLAIWDIDFFKKVNDTYGHKAGDKVLKTVAQLLNKRIRSTDFLARYGGEEFVMLLPGTRQEETLRLVNELRLQVESCGFHYHGNSVKITVSCGISCFNENDTLAQVFDRADQALYKAKDNGRNQCIAAACLSD